MSEITAIRLPASYNSDDYVLVECYACKKELNDKPLFLVKHVTESTVSLCEKCYERFLEGL